MARLDDAEAYFGKPGEVIICGFTGARTCPRIGSSSQESQSPRIVEMRSPSPTPSRSSAYSAHSESYQRSNSSRYETPQKYIEYPTQVNYGRGSSASSYAPSYVSSGSGSARQYSPNAQGFYESNNSRYY